jgi:hypothetical protein
MLRKREQVVVILQRAFRFSVLGSCGSQWGESGVSLRAPALLIGPAQQEGRRHGTSKMEPAQVLVCERDTWGEFDCCSRAVVKRIAIRSALISITSR